MLPAASTRCAAHKHWLVRNNCTLKPKLSGKALGLGSRKSFNGFFFCEKVERKKFVTASVRKNLFFGELKNSICK